MKSISRVLDRTLAVACVVLFAALTLIVSWQVFTRQVLDSPSTWSTEAAQYTFVWLGFFGAALVFSERGHIAVDFFVRRFPKHLMRVVLVLIQLTIITLAAVVLVYGGWKYSQQAWGQQVSSLPVNVGQMYLVLPISGVLIIWYAVTHLIDSLTVSHPIELLALDEEAEVALEQVASDPATGLVIEADGDATAPDDDARRRDGQNGKES